MCTARLPSDTEIGRVALAVADPQPVVSFYRDVVGLTVTQSDADRTVLGAGDTDLLVLAHRPDAPKRDASETGLYHVAFRVPSRAALGDALRRIEAEWTLSGVADHGTSEALYLSDPAGNGVEIYRDLPRESWEVTPDGQVSMSTDPLDTDAVAAAGTGEQLVPAGSDIGHVHLAVSSLDAARAFYADALGLDVKMAAEGALFMAAGGYHHHVGANVWQRRTAPQRGEGLSWFELRLPGQSAVGAVSERMRQAGYAVEASDEGVAVRDEDGIELRLRR